MARLDLNRESLCRSRMNGNDRDIAGVVSAERKRVVSFDLNVDEDDDDMDIDVKSSTNSDDTIGEADGLDSVSKKNGTTLASVKSIRKQT